MVNLYLDPQFPTDGEFPTSGKWQVSGGEWGRQKVAVGMAKVANVAIESVMWSRTFFQQGEGGGVESCVM